MSSQRIRSRRMPTQKTVGASKRHTTTETASLPFDICITENEPQLKFDEPLHEKTEDEYAKKTPRLQYLRSGMMLLKDFISHTDQVQIVKKCRDLGIGCGGFYKPAYEDGTKLNLHMMCLGKDWDLRTKSYNYSRIVDGAVSPAIPGELRNHVDVALQAARNFLNQNAKNEEEIPSMFPDICIVNFYSDGDKLGLHQDKDERSVSLEKGLPVVSFSIGDSAEFLYSDSRNESLAEKIILESGDVLIFGGESRLIYHGVSQIIPDTMPKLLTDETNLRPGRLNLTFRKY